jgi:hypothetical protein
MVILDERGSDARQLGEASFIVTLEKKSACVAIHGWLDNFNVGDFSVDQSH